jgi:tetratricopeptide (TPR) repeat protein
MLIAFSIVYRSDKKKYRYAFLLIIVSLFHTFPWVINNNNESISLARAENMADTYYWSSHSKAILYDELSQYYYNKKDLNKALFFMQKAYTYEPNERFYYSLGVINHELGNNDTARKIFEDIKNSGYMAYNINLFLGNIYFEKKLLNEADSCYKEVLKLNPQNENIAFNLGLINYSLNKLTESSNYFKIALRINPNNIETLKNLGQIYFDLKNYKDAVRVFLKATVIEQNNSSINYYIALCYANLSYFDESLKYLENAKSFGLDSISYNELKKSIKNYSFKKY